MSVPKYSTCMTLETELENQFSGLLQLETSCWYCISPGVSVPGLPDDILQQIVSEASAAAKNRTSNV